MHAAIWSQPVVCKKVHRCDSASDIPLSKIGKIVFGISIGFMLLGGTLSILGLTGYFAVDGTKYYLAFAGIVGVVSVLSGLVGIRAATRKSKARRYTMFFIFLSWLSWANSVTMIVLGALILQHHPDLLLTAILAWSEIAISVVISVIAAVGFVIVVRYRLQMMYPEQKSDEIEERDVPVYPEDEIQN